MAAVAVAAAAAAPGMHSRRRRSFPNNNSQYNPSFLRCVKKLQSVFSSHHSNRAGMRAAAAADDQESTAPPRRVTHKPDVIGILEERGLIDSATDIESLRRACTDDHVKVYCGFDPTAESLHLGNLLGIIVLSWFRRCGHTAVALVGGATGRIGDPSGKSLERPELSASDLERNIDGIRDTIASIFSRVASTSASPSPSFLILNNHDWWKEIRVLDFLRNAGRHARVGTMMSKESVRKRLESEQGLSFTEFTYQLLQAYDFLHLFEKEGVCLQIGGSDQWGNITAGTDLIRKVSTEGGAAYGLTFPLLLKRDGTKFGKSESGAVWLSPSILSPYRFYQYFFSVADADVVKFLQMLTFMEAEEIRAVEAGMGAPGYVPNAAQRELAAEVTRFVHGEEGLAEALRATAALRPGGGLDAPGSVPSCCLAADQVLHVPIVILSLRSGLMESKAAARRLVRQGGLYLNNQRVVGEDRRVEEGDIVDGKALLLSADVITYPNSLSSSWHSEKIHHVDVLHGEEDLVELVGRRGRVVDSWSAAACNPARLVWQREKTNEDRNFFTLRWKTEGLCIALGAASAMTATIEEKGRKEHFHADSADQLSRYLHPGSWCRLRVHD